MLFLSRFSSRRPRRAFCCYDHWKSKCPIRGKGHLLWDSKPARNLLGTMYASLQQQLNWFKYQIRASRPKGLIYRGLEPQFINWPTREVPLQLYVYYHTHISLMHSFV